MQALLEKLVSSVIFLLLLVEMHGVKVVADFPEHAAALRVSHLRR